MVTAFSGLNSRIDSFIQSARDMTHVVRKNDPALSVDLVRLYPNQIGRLVIRDVAAVDISPLRQLRSLTLKNGTHEQIAGIQPEHFPALEILHIIMGE